MPLKTSYFNKGIFKNNIKRYWLISFSYTFFLFLFIVDYLFTEIEGMNRSSIQGIVSSVGQDILDRGDFAIFLGLFPLISALAVFSYMHFPKNTAMIHSLPLTRSTLFVTNYLSGLFLVTIPLVINSLILIITEVLAGFPDLSYALIWIGINLITTFLLYNFAVFAGMFTGHMAAQTIFFYIFNFLVVFLEAVAVRIFHHFLFGYVSGYSSSTFEAWSPLAYLTSLYRGFQNNRGDIIALIGYVLAGMVFLALSYYLYKKRHMEVATDVISFSFVKPIFKYSVAFCSAALIGGIILTIFGVENNLAAYIISYLIGGFIGFFAAEMLMRKTFKVFNSYKGYIAFALVLSLFLCSIDFDLFGYERRVPKDSEVEVIAFNTYRNEAMSIALRPEDYDPDRHRYLLSTREYAGPGYDKFYDDYVKHLSDEQIKDLRDSTLGVFENREVITKVREIHSYIVKNKDIFIENERLMRKDSLGQLADYFDSRYICFMYRLEDGSLLEREYDLLTYKDNTELDDLLREYISLPGVRESYEPILVQKAEDIRGIYINYETKDGQYNNSEIVRGFQGFLDNYKKDILASDPLNSMFSGIAETEYSHLSVSIDYLKNEDSIYEKREFSGTIYSSFGNTINYLVEEGIFEPEELMLGYYY